MSDPMQDFLAVRAQASKGNDGWMRQAAGSPSPAPSGSAAPAPSSLAGATGGGKAAAGGTMFSQNSNAEPALPPGGSASQPAAATSSPPGTEASQPFGVRFSNWLSASAQRAKAMVMARPEDRDQTLGQALIGGVEGIPAEIGKQFVDNLRAAGHDSLPASLQRLRDSLDKPLSDQVSALGDVAQNATGIKTAQDLIGAAFSPLTGALTSLAGRPVEELTGVKRELTGNILSLFAGPEGVAKLAKLGDLAKGAKAADIASLNEAGAASSIKGEGAVPGAAPASAGSTTEAANVNANAARGAPSASGPATPQRMFDLAGEQPGSALKITPKVRQQASDFFAGKRDNPVAVHLDQLADESTRAEVVNQIAKVIPKDEVKPIDVSRMGAYSLNLSPDEVMAALKPRFPSDEHFAAALMAQNSAAKVFWDTARTAMESRDPADVEAATRAYAEFNQYTGALRDAKTEWGRAGRIQQEAFEARSDFTKHIQDVVANVGPDNVEEVIAKTAQLDDPAKVSPFVASMRWMGGREGLMYGWYNWLLSHAVVGKKVASDLAMAAYNVPVRYAAEKFGSGAVQPGEAMALLKGYLGSMSDGIRAAGKALKAGQSQFEGDYQSLFDGRLMGRVGKMADGAPPTLADAGPTRNAIEFLRMAMPTSAMGAADDFAKVINYRAEVHAMAWRDAMKNGLEGEAFDGHVDNLVNNVTQGMHDQAVAAALRNTLQEPLEGVAKAIQDTFDKINIPVGKTGFEIPVGRIVMPFTKISANVLRYAYRNSPLPLVAPSAAYRAELAAGGATRDLALARVGLGTAVSMIVGGMAVGGFITGGGPTSPDLQAAWRRAGNNPYTIKTPMGLDVRYDKVEPIGTLVGAIADTHELLKYAKDEDADALAASLVLGVGHAMINKAYMQGMADFIDAIHEPDQSGAKYAENLLATFAIPGEANMLTRGIDEWARTHNGLIDTIAARTPVWSMSLPPARTLWGDPIPRDSAFGGIGRMMSPVTFQPNDTAAPIDKWIWNHREDFPSGPQGRLGLERPGLVFESNGVRVKLSDAQLDRLRVLGGNELKDPATGLGAKDALSSLVQGEYPDRATQEQWNRANAAVQARMVQTIWRRYREAAKGQLLNDDKGLQDTIASAVTGQRAIQQPTMGATP